MTQEVKIGVNADTRGATAAIGAVDKATEALNKSMEHTAKATADATRQVDALERAARRLSTAQGALKQTLGRPVGPSDAQTFLDNFDRMRPRSPSLRKFEDFEGWWKGHSTAYGSPGQASRHRRAVFSAALQGTSYADEYGAPAPDAPGSPGGGGGAPPPGGTAGPANGGVAGMAKSAVKTALGFTGAGLALAGIGSVMSMAGQAIQMAQAEAMATDNTKRRLGGLGVDYLGVQDETRGAAGALRANYVQAAAYGNDFVRGAGNLAGPDLGHLGGMLSNAGQFANAYGMEAGQGVGFFASMRRLGVAGDEQGQRRLAGEIADAIDRSGYAAKADELVKAIGDFAETTSRSSLARANVTGYASALSALTSTGLPGLDPQGAAALLSGADSALRGGGSAGEAGQNFLFQALHQEGMSPFATKGLMQGGLFASTSSIFSKGGALSGWYKGKLSGKTNLERIQDMIARYGLSREAAADAMSHVFGGTEAQNVELLGLHGKALTDKSAQMQARAAEQDPATKMQASLQKMEDALTNAGGPLISVLNPIRDAVVDLANHFLPNRAADASDRQYAANDISAGNAGLSAYAGADSNKRGKAGSMLRRALQHAASAVGEGGTFDIDKYVANIPDKNLREGLRAGLLREKRWVGMLNDSDREVGLDPGTGVRQAMKESGMDPGAMSKAGAIGLLQFMPDTVRRLTPRFRTRYGHDPDPSNPEDSIRLRTLLMADDMKMAHGDGRLALRIYQGGPDQSKWGAQNAAYPDGVYAGHQMPSQAAMMANASMKHDVQVGGTVVMADAQGNTKGTVILRQMGPATSTGTN